MSQRCHAKSTRTGEQCKRYAVEGLTVCPMHGGATKRSKAKAHRLLDQSALPAVITLRNIMLDENTDDSLKVKTAIALLDRVPGFGRNSHVETSNPVLEGVMKSIFKLPAELGEVAAVPEDTRVEQSDYGVGIYIDRTVPDDMRAEFDAAQEYQVEHGQIESEPDEDEPRARDFLPQIVPAANSESGRATVRRPPNVITFEDEPEPPRPRRR